MNKPRKHAEVIRMWADGAKVQRAQDGEWVDDRNPLWVDDEKYRIKPAPKPDVVEERTIGYLVHSTQCYGKVQYTWDASTGRLKDCRVIGE